MSYILTNFGDDKGLQDGDYYLCNGITVDPTNKNFLECLRLITTKVGNDRRVEEFLLGYCREHDDPRFLDLMFKMATPVKFLERANTRLGPSCWLCLKEKIGEKEARKQWDSLYLMPLQRKSKKSFALALSIRPFFFRPKKLFFHDIIDFVGRDADLEEVLLALRSGAIVEKDMVEFYDMLADNGLTEISRYLKFHPLKT